MNSRRVVFTALIVLFFVLGTVFYFERDSQTRSSYQDYPHNVVLDGNIIHVAITDTPESRAQGLGGLSGLLSDEGMLFVFPRDGKYAFWMKEMQFSIDILWLSSDGRIIYIVPNLSPDSYPKSYVSNTPTRYVLELPAGYVAEHDVKVGDIVQL